MTKKADIGSKRLIGLAPDAWSQWVTQSADVSAIELLDSEFQWISRQNDVLIKAFSPVCGDFLIVNEIQLRFDSQMPRRMRAYAALAEEKFRLPIYPVVVNILPPAANTVIPDRFESEVLGLRARQDFRVINLWEVDAQIVFDRSLSPLLPFVPVLRGGGESAIVREAVRRLRQEESLNELEPLLAFFASFVLDTQLVRQILRWDMTVLRESPWYQEIKAQEVLSLILRQLNRRVGSVPPELLSQIQGLPIDTLESLGEALLDFNSVEDLQQWLSDRQ